MIRIIRLWLDRLFADPQAVLLLAILGLGSGLILTLGEILAPVLASIVIAYLLEGVVKYLERYLPRLPALIVVYLGFFSLIIITSLVLIPAIWEQLANLIDELPILTHRLQDHLQVLSHRFPELFSSEQIHLFIQGLMQDVKGWGKTVLTFSLSSLTGLMASLIYLVLMPFLVFFFLKDRDLICSWFKSFLPQERQLLTAVSEEVNQQIANYVRGKVTEMVILGISTYVVFAFFHLKYAVLLAFLVGLSALIPYVGAVVVSLPVCIVAFLQWGSDGAFVYLMGAYLLVHALDANLLVPLLFSEAVNLHPVAIVVATLIFGGVWGFWGIFFAIPLATLVKAVLYAWPQYNGPLAGISGGQSQLSSVTSD